MDEYMFGVTYEKPPKKTANLWDRICRQEGGSGYTEVNRRAGETPGINHGRYQGWFTGPNLGEPFNSALRDSVLDRIK